MTRHQRSNRPYAVLITTDAVTLEQRDVLVSVGFTVVVVRSLLAGYAQIRRLLAPTQSSKPTLVLVDVLGFDLGFPEFPGLLLAAVLARHIRLGTLRPAWLVGIVPSHAPEDDTEAVAAGCQHVLRLPLTPDALVLLRSLAEKPAPIPHQDASPDAIRAIEALQRVAYRVLRAVQVAQARAWTPQEVALILRWLTPYPARSGAAQQATSRADEIAQIKTLLRGLGGPRAARQRLEAIATQWQTRYPLHSAILRKFLEGWERREIVRYFVDRGLYEDSRIYYCIKDLPRRICDQFRREQAAQQEDLSLD
jgi:CheY-like chemotaxis protein